VSGDGYTRLYATATGLLLVVAGLLGFLVGSDFEDPELTGSLLGFYPVNGWANSLHVLTGILALALAPRRSRTWAWIGALLFTGLGLWGVFAPDGTLLAGVLPASRSVNLVNLLLGLSAVLALSAGPLENRAERASTRKRARRVRPRIEGTTPASAGPGKRPTAPERD
jgi:hypothetical protein